MIYKFKSKATGDLVMTGEVGDRLMRLIGREPAPQGIFTPEQIPATIAALEAAVLADEAARRAADEEAQREGRPLPRREVVGLRQRVWPLVEMLRRAQAAGHPIVWGV